MLLNADEMEAASLPIGLCDEGKWNLVNSVQMAYLIS